MPTQICVGAPARAWVNRLLQVGAVPKHGAPARAWVNLPHLMFLQETSRRSRARVGEPPELGNGFQSSTYGAPARAWVNLDNADLRSMLYASRVRVGEPA